MWSIIVSSPATYLLLTWLGLLGVSFALARHENIAAMQADLDQRFSWKWLQPAPAELRPLMRHSLARPGMGRNVVAAYHAELTQLTQRIGQIRL